MKKIISLDEHEFAAKILKMKTDEEIEFAINADLEDGELVNPECWYFAKKMYIPGYESRFILIDYCGGEEAFAIPMNCNSDKADLDDVGIVNDYVHRFWESCCSDIDNFVYVEIGED